MTTDKQPLDVRCDICGKTLRDHSMGHGIPMCGIYPVYRPARDNIALIEGFERERAGHAEALAQAMQNGADNIAQSELIETQTNQILVLEQFAEAAQTRIAELERENELVRVLVEALEPFAKYGDRYRVMPEELQITHGTYLAKRQLTMADCYRAIDALALVPQDQGVSDEGVGL